jgi:hypothetical protein
MRRGIQSYNYRMNWNEERLAFHYFLGTTVAKWAHIEHMLGELLVILERNHRQSPWRALLFRLRRRSRRSLGQEFVYLSRRGSFRKQLKLLDEIVRERLYDAQQRETWRQIRKKLERLYSQRNSLAHCVIVNYLNADEGRRVAAIDWWKPQNGVSPPNDAICVQDICAIDSRFTQSFRLIKNLSRVIQGLPAGYMPEDLPPILTLPQIEHEIRVQITGAGAAEN